MIPVANSEVQGESEGLLRGKESKAEEDVENRKPLAHDIVLGF